MAASTREIKQNLLLNIDGRSDLDLVTRSFSPLRDLIALSQVSTKQKQIIKNAIKAILNNQLLNLKLTPEELFDFASQDVAYLKEVINIPALFTKLLGSQRSIRQITDNLNNAVCDMGSPAYYIETLYNSCYFVKLWKKFPFIRTEEMLAHITLQQHKDALIKEYPLTPKPKPFSSSSNYHPSKFCWPEQEILPTESKEAKETPTSSRQRTCWFGF
jgi:hypothetical protein